MTDTEPAEPTEPPPAPPTIAEVMAKLPDLDRTSREIVGHLLRSTGLR